MFTESNPSETWKRMAGVYPSYYIPSPKIPPIFVIVIAKWQMVLCNPSLMARSLIISGLNGSSQRACLPDPCDPLKSSLQSLEEKAIRLKKNLESAQRLVTKFDIKLGEIRHKHTGIDYRLATMDGRMKTVKPHRPEIGKPARQSEGINISKMLNRLSGRQKERLLEQLLK